MHVWTVFKETELHCVKTWMSVPGTISITVTQERLVKTTLAVITAAV